MQPVVGNHFRQTESKVNDFKVIVHTDGWKRDFVYSYDHLISVLRFGISVNCYG
jgi:hypothetical protein